MKNKYLISVLSVIAGLLIGFGVHSYMTTKVRNKIDNFSQTVLKSNRTSYKIERIDPLTGKIKLTDVVINDRQSGIPIHIDQIEISKFDADNKIPMYGNFKITGIHFPMDNFKTIMSIKRTPNVPLETLPQICKIFSTDELLMNMSMDYKYNHLRKRLKINQVVLNIENIGGIEMELDIAGLPLPGEPLNLYDITLSKLSVAVQNDGLRECIVKFTEKTKGIPEKTLMKQGWYAIKAMNIGEDATRSLFNFINGDSKGIIVTFKPREPVHVMAMGKIVQSPVQLRNLPITFQNF